MAMATVKVSQLKSGFGQSYLNVEEKDGYVEVWGSSYTQPTYLFKRVDGRCIFQFVVFDNQQFADEYIQNDPDLVIVARL